MPANANEPCFCLSFWRPSFLPWLRRLSFLSSHNLSVFVFSAPLLHFCAGQSVPIRLHALFPHACRLASLSPRFSLLLDSRNPSSSMICHLLSALGSFELSSHQLQIVPS